MRAQDFLRKMADIIDAVDPAPAEPAVVAVVEPEADADQQPRLDQIKDLLGQEFQQFVNEPDGSVAGIEAVTASGTDVNKSKHPADIRVAHTSMYPFAQAGARK